jgi:transcriptional regulator with GAF, ATPase, and Fis domain
VTQETRTQEIGRAPAPLAFPVVVLEVIDGPDRGRRLELSQPRARIGTSPGCDLQLSDPKVSRVHAEVSLAPWGLRLRDLGSKNGTYVDGLRVRDVDVAVGTTLKLATSAIRIEATDDQLSIELSARDRLGKMVGGSVEMRRIYAIVERVAPTETTVLVGGETGTGKELVAQAVHQLSPRAQQPFIPLDCGSIPESLIESELFGHARGAFTGAVASRIGVLEEASGGTLFLDEVGELSVPMQKKLLRALETRRLRRIGENDERAFDVRIVAATNRPLSQAVNEGLFREDLYYRLAVVQVDLPPLRARREDIPLLARHFYADLTRGESTGPPPELLAALVSKAWPGNVRELRNYIERTIALGAPLRPGGVAAPQGAPRDAAYHAIPTDLPYKEAREAWTGSFERVYVRTLLERSGWNVTHAALEAGLSRRFLQRLMIRVGLRAEVDDTGEPVR